jgi:hypothetical protein
MDIPLIGSLEHWHDFYTLVGSASATLVGLMFVAVSISDGAFTHQHQMGIRAFLSPTVVHFSAILIVCLISTLPDETWKWCALLLIITGAQNGSSRVYGDDRCDRPFLVRTTANRQLPHDSCGRRRSLPAFHLEPGFGGVRIDRAAPDRS